MPILTDALYERRCGANRPSIYNWRLLLAAVLACEVSLMRKCWQWQRKKDACYCLTIIVPCPGTLAISSPQESPGVIIMPQRRLISVAVEWIITIWSASEAEEWMNQIIILPR